jgi:putative ABC transport system substrate-binding protein
MAVSRRRLLVLGGSLAVGEAALGRVMAQSAVRERKLGLLLLAPFPGLTDPFFAALAQRGWSTGRNLRTDARFTAPQQERAVEMARQLIAQGSEIIVVSGSANAVAAREATSTVPIVSLGIGYPVESGLAASLARPGGNVTGMTVYAGTEVFGKYVSLARELVPSLREFGVFWAYAPPMFPAIETELPMKEMRQAADALKIRMHTWVNRDEDELDRNLKAAAREQLQLIFVSAGGPHSVPQGVAKIGQFSQQRRIFTLCDVAGVFFSAAGIAAYSPDFNELGAGAASYVDRILRGANPGDLPIEHPKRFELIINARRAKASGVPVPAAVLARADRIIE